MCVEGTWLLLSFTLILINILGKWLAFPLQIFASKDIELNILSSHPLATFAVKGSDVDLFSKYYIVGN